MGGLRRQFDRLLERRQIVAPDRELDREQRWRHVRAFGDFAVAYGAATENYLKSFGDRRGFVAYGQKMGFTFALGDPLAAPGDADVLLDEFIERFGGPSFVQVGEGMAARLAARGYLVNRMGIDRVLDLPGERFAGRKWESVRYASNWLRTNRYTIRECAPGEVPRDRIEEISRRWMQTRAVGHRETHFLNRPFTVDPPPDVRRFFVFDPQGAPVAFVSFDPVYRGGRAIGYVSSQKRREPGAPTYCELGITRHAAEAFRDEGLEALHMGLSPFARIEPSGWREDRLLRAFLGFAHRSSLINRKVYNFQGLTTFKARFHGREVPLYLASPGPGNLTRIVALLRLCRLA